MISQTHSQVELEQSRELQPNDSVFSIFLLSQISLGYLPSFSRQQLIKNNQIEVLKDLTGLLELIPEQEKKYE